MDEMFNEKPQVGASFIYSNFIQTAAKDFKIYNSRTIELQERLSENLESILHEDHSPKLKIREY
jgi:hypothetical protein